MPSVLILGARAPVALDHARRFRRQGWTVHVADSVSCRISHHSEAVASHVALPPPRQAPVEFAAALARAVQALGVDLVLPTCEEVFHLSRHRAALPAQLRVLAEDFGLLRRLHSKWLFLAMARDLGVQVPESALVATIGEAREWAGGAPVVLKSEFSRFGVHVRLHPEGLPADAPELPALGDWVVQRHAPGGELCSYAVADRGVLRAFSVYRPTWRLRRSASFYFAPVANEAIRGFVAGFVARHGFTGQIAFDWIEAEDGALTVIECNPRATSGLHLFSADDPLPAALAGEGAGCLQPGQARAAMIAPIMAGPGLVSAVAGGRLRQWWHDWRRADDVITRPGDRAPLAGALLDLGAYARLAWRQGCSLREASTRDIEWDGEALPPA